MSKITRKITDLKRFFEIGSSMREPILEINKCTNELTLYNKDGVVEYVMQSECEYDQIDMLADALIKDMLK